MPDDTRTCSVCSGTFTNSGKNVLIQKNLRTGKEECIECAFKEWEKEDAQKRHPKGST
jgi:hypothetical protein